MTQTQFDLNELLEAIKAGGDIDVLRRGAEMLYQALIEAELSERIGAERFERSDSHRAREDWFRTSWSEG